MSVYFFVLKLPDDGTPPSKHVEFNIRYELYFIKCICWLMY